jgi:hypothetical protein
MEADSAEMLREVFDLQMKAHVRYAEKRATAAAIEIGDSTDAQPKAG